ncbi:MAG: metallopeptidase family protein [SAR202 cluster bacterium]|nr:metallopeptidase family protein [SAR202 cluster bacterium]
MTRQRFEDLVRRALDTLPGEFYERLQNVDVVVDDEPTAEQLRTGGVEEGHTLLGLYEGVPLTARENYGFVLPDKITIFKRPIEEMCDSADAVVEEVQQTVMHEIAHHFGMDDEELHELGL